MGTDLFSWTVRTLYDLAPVGSGGEGCDLVGDGGIDPHRCRVGIGPVCGVGAEKGS